MLKKEQKGTEENITPSKSFLLVLYNITFSERKLPNPQTPIYFDTTLNNIYNLLSDTKRIIYLIK